MSLLEISIVGGTILVVVLLKKFGVKKEKIEKYIPVEKEECSLEEREFVRLVNEYRISQGLPFLKLEALASNLCSEHVEYMRVRRQLSHDFYISRQKDSRANLVGEICARGFVIPKSLLQVYLSSPKHKAILDNPNYTWIGTSSYLGYNCTLLLNYD